MAKAGGDASSAISKVSEWADEHLRLIRNISTGMAVAGIILFARSIKLTSKFTKGIDIPVEFIEKNVKLRGRVLQITERGLEVEHVPITIPFISSWQKRCRAVKWWVGCSACRSGTDTEWQNLASGTVETLTNTLVPVT